MGRKKYYCEYCLKSFNDDPNARALHLNGLRHLQAKDEHYRQFKDPAMILEDELKKEPCMRFRREGDCHFGTSCRYSHLLEHDIERLKQQIAASQGAQYDDAQIPEFTAWYAERIRMAESQEQTPMSHTLPVPPDQLPISLRPFPIKDFVDANISSWGE